MTAARFRVQKIAHVPDDRETKRNPLVMSDNPIPASGTYRRLSKDLPRLCSRGGRSAPVVSKRQVSHVYSRLVAVSPLRAREFHACDLQVPHLSRIALECGHLLAHHLRRNRNPLWRLGPKFGR